MRESLLRPTSTARSRLRDPGASLPFDPEITLPPWVEPHISRLHPQADLFLGRILQISPKSTRDRIAIDRARVASRSAQAAVRE